MKKIKCFLFLIAFVAISTGTLFAQTATDKLLDVLQTDIDIQTVENLISAGADVKAADEDGMTVLDYAKENEAIYKTDIYWKLTDLSY